MLRSLVHARLHIIDPSVHRQGEVVNTTDRPTRGPTFLRAHITTNALADFAVFHKRIEYLLAGVGSSFLKRVGTLGKEIVARKIC